MKSALSCAMLSLLMCVPGRAYDVATGPVVADRQLKFRPVRWRACHRRASRHGGGKTPPLRMRRPGAARWRGPWGLLRTGVYEALAEAGIHPEWIAGVSVGAINAAIIAGNPPNSRVDQLREFSKQTTAGGLWTCLGDLRLGVTRGDTARNIFMRRSRCLFRD
jgi:hypothetical protein